MANRQRRVRRSREEIENELREQLDLLADACDRYDSGKEAVAKHISISLRVLLYQHGNSRSLLDQVGLRDGWFYDTAGPINSENLFSQCNLVAMQVTTGIGAKHIPSCKFGNGPLRLIKRPFDKWWNDYVCKDAHKQYFNRRDLVLNVANTDGGAHVDPELDERYEALTRKNGFPTAIISWNFGAGDIVQKLEGKPELACMREIAFEVLKTLTDRDHQFVYTSWAKVLAPVTAQPLHFVQAEMKSSR